MYIKMVAESEPSLLQEKGRRRTKEALLPLSSPSLERE
ncbi:hypothetical protein A343_1245 [Porphyromonas gingivalis JCVI SC001]|nr:hypothetical protein A343_1245 [Porphyromonas gingivalis JCVI SC001]